VKRLRILKFQFPSCARLTGKSELVCVLASIQKITVLSWLSTATLPPSIGSPMPQSLSILLVPARASTINAVGSTVGGLLVGLQLITRLLASRSCCRYSFQTLHGRILHAETHAELPALTFMELKGPNIRLDHPKTKCPVSATAYSDSACASSFAPMPSPRLSLLSLARYTDK